MRGDWQQTFTGRQFWPLDPQKEDLDIRDIAHALSNQCRFGGHTSRHYSVAEHSLLVADLCFLLSKGEHSTIPGGETLELAALMHDASEAYLVDIPSPVKPHLQNYEALEDTLMAAISARWDFSWPMPQRVKDADRMALAIEKQALLGLEPEPWPMAYKPPAAFFSLVRSEPQSIPRIKDKFLHRFYWLCESRVSGKSDHPLVQPLKGWANRGPYR